MSERKWCGSCGSTELGVILDLGRAPLANEFPTDPRESLRSWPLQMLQCECCSLVQIGYVVPDELLWRGEYGYYSSTSPALRTHFADYARDILLRFPSQSMRGNVVEVGCNDGILLKHFAAAGARTVGVDPAKGPVAVAQSGGLDVRCEAFGLDWANRFVREDGPATLVLANNVAAHVAGLPEFLSGLRALLDPNGILVMEVQYLPDLLVGNGFDMLYHEHRFFYSLSSLREALRLRGLVIFDVEFVETQGGSIRVFARRNDAAIVRDDHARVRVENALYAESKLGPLTGLQFRANRIAQRLQAELRELRRAGLTIAGYGAPAKATTLLHWTGTADYLSWVEDTTPVKQGRYMPGHAVPLPIVAPTEGSARPDAYLLTSWNYAPFIFAKEREYLGAGGRFVVPLPAPITLGGIP